LYKVSDANKVLITAYGTMARICQTAIDELEEEGISVGLFRPITLFPFPEREVYDEAVKKNIKAILCVEMSTGQMVEDIERCVKGKKPIGFYGRTGGIVPTPNEVKDAVRRQLGGKSKPKAKANAKKKTPKAAKPSSRKKRK
jgi:2-oxoglutarate ferredoxin oxidoreductase subunit alpha